MFNDLSHFIAILLESYPHFNSAGTLWGTVYLFSGDREKTQRYRVGSKDFIDSIPVVLVVSG